MSSSYTSKSVRFFNPFSVAVAILVAASFALVSPLKAQSGARTLDSSVDVLPGTDVPPSMQGTVQVMVEMNAAPAAVPYAAALKVAQAQADTARAYALAHPRARTSQAILSQPKIAQVSASAVSQVKNTIQQLDQAQQAILPALTAPDIGGTIIYRVQRAYNGIAMSVSPDKISQIAALPGVKAVHPIHLKYPTAFTDIDFLGTRSFWGAGFGGAHGETIKVGVIDSGLDYVHTNFGGTASYAGVGDAAGATGGQFPSAKVPGGTDLCGDAYNGGNVPVPDSNPFDGNPALGASAGHGTACASLIGGYGVDAGGTTYGGSYTGPGPTPLPSIAGMKISPGFAPKCLLYPIRVFGNSGGTGLVTAALDWAMDPNGDGNFADHLDVVSMSLGSNEGYADDDSAVASSNAASVGIVVCSASGNAGDTFYVTSSPAVASGTLSVAASFNDQGGFIYDASITPNTNAGAGSPPDGKYKAIYGSPSAHVPGGGLTGDVVYGVPNDAGPALAPSPSPAPGIAYYGTFSNTISGSISGKICLVDRGGSVSFVQKCARAQNSGAIAAIVDNFTVPGADPLTMALNTEITIPCVMISKADRDAIVAAAGGFNATTGLPTNSPVNVTIKNDNGAFLHATTAADTMAGYSARGPRLGDTALKPDITAPAEIVGVAVDRSGNAVQNFNGTSSATPHVAGSMALMRQVHPTWTVEELMALAINTATHELTTGPSPVPLPTPVPSPGLTYGVSRVGAGRIDLAKAAAANVVAFNQTNPGLVSVSFGVVEVPADGSTTLTKSIKIKNNSVSSVTYGVTYQDITPASGATFTVPAGPITVGPSASGTFNVTFSATGSALRHERDSSITTTQPTSVGNVSRQWLTEKAGYAVLTPTPVGPEPIIRVPLYAAPKPIGTMRATATGVVPDAASGTFTINLSGLSINTGATFPTDIIGLVKPFELQYAGSPGASTDPNVIKYVGVTSDWTNRTVAERNAGAPVVTFAIEGFGDASVPEFNSSDKEILIDFDFDSVYDAQIFLTSRGNTANGNAHTNVYRPVYVDLAGFFGPPGLAYGLSGPTNLISPATRDTNSFNNSALLVPIAGAGLVGTGFSSFNYQVVTFDRSGNVVDQTPVLFWDAANPGFDTIPAASGAQTVPSSGPLLEPFMFTDLASTSIAVNYNGTNFQNNASLGVLLTHMHNGAGNRTDVVAFRKPTITSFSPTSGKVGALITIHGTNFGPGTIVKFFNNKTASVNLLTSTTLVATVPALAVSGPITVSNAAGASQSPGNFTVLP